jgi:hypothetical protein
MDVTVYYAWQSDSPEDHNRYLIRNAARDACDRITADTSNDWEVTLDHDTKDIPGMCDIPNTILAKIRMCDIFLADLTLVGKTEAGKLLPNSNVVFELGYAARQLSFKALVAVFNESSGKVEAQVFDLKRRKGLKYTTVGVKSKSELKKVTDELSKDLEKIICDTIRMVVLPKKGKAAAARDQLMEARREEVAQRILKGEFHGLKEKPVVLTSFFFAQHTHLDYEGIGGTIRERFRVNPSVGADTYVWSDNSSISEFSLSGSLHRACVRDFKSVQQWHSFLGEGGVTAKSDRFLPAEPLQVNVVRGVLAYSRFLTSLGIKPPWQIAVSLVGAMGWQLTDQQPEAGPKPIAKDILHLLLLRVSKAAQVKDGLNAGALLRSAFQFLTMSVGWEFNWLYTEDGKFMPRIY